MDDTDTLRLTQHKLGEAQIIIRELENRVFKAERKIEKLKAKLRKMRDSDD
jgi:hypothetical protein